MRNVFLALLLGNLAFAAWHAWFAGPPPAATPASGRTPPGLTLMTETPARPTAANAASGLPIARDCTSVGPFPDDSQTDTAADTLRAAGFEPRPREVASDVWIGYWVFITLARTDDARAALAQVREAGITDSYVMPNTDGGNLLSLGLVSDNGGVNRLSEQIRELGFEPQVLDRTRRATVYWLDVPLPDGRALDLASLTTPERIAPLEQRSCDGGGP